MGRVFCFASMTMDLIAPFLAQAPFVGVILYLFHRFKLAQDEARDRFINHLESRDTKLEKSLACLSDSHDGVGREIKGLAVQVAKLETRLGN